MRHALIAVAVGLTLSGCASLPPINATAADLVTTDRKDRNLATAEQDPASRQLLEGFQSIFKHDARAQQVLKYGFEQNADIATAQARVLQARADVRTNRSLLFPTIGVDIETARRRASLKDPTRIGSAQNADRNSTRWNGGLSAAWTIDLFGRQRALQQSAQWLLTAESAKWADTRLAMLGDLSGALIDLRSAQARLAIAEQNIGIDLALLQIDQAKRRGGQISDIEVRTAEAQWETSKAAASSIHTERLQHLQRLATLTGAALQETTGFAGEGEPSMDRANGIDQWMVPSDLLQRRPDIIEADARLASADAELRSAMRARYPEFTLVGTLGWVAGTLSGLNGSGALAASITPRANWTFLDFGQRAADVERRTAERQEAVVGYENTVNSAFVEAEAAVQAVSLAQAEAEMRANAAIASRKAAELTHLKFRAGIEDLSATLESRREANNAAEQQAAAVAAMQRSWITALTSFGGSPIQQTVSLPSAMTDPR